MPESVRKRCIVAWAQTGRQCLWEVELEAGASVAAALAAARRLAPHEEVPWDDAPVGIFGEIVPRETIPRAGDRIEIYRPLPVDPRTGRRERVQRHRRAGRR